MDVKYVGQLSPAWGISDHALSQLPQIWRVFTSFFTWQNFVPKTISNKRKYQERTKNQIPKLGSDRYIYVQFYIDFTPIGYIVSFWRTSNTLLEGNFKNTKTDQRLWGQQMVRPLLFYLEKFNQIDS